MKDFWMKCKHTDPRLRIKSDMRMQLLIQNNDQGRRIRAQLMTVIILFAEEVGRREGILDDADN